MIERKAFEQKTYMTVFESDRVNVEIPMETDGIPWSVAIQDVTTLYTDGGVFRPKRCEAGSWAWVGADQQGRRRVYQYGWMEACGVLQGGVTNNQSEFAAMLKALEAMPDRWSGRVCSDSEVTIGRFCDSWRLAGIPTSWERRMYAAQERLGDLIYVLLKGHPTKAEVAAGEGTRGRSGRTYPVSEHQVFCDTLCSRMLEEWAVASGATR